MTLEEQLQKKVDRLMALNADLRVQLRVAKKHLRDSYMGAILSGLAAHWSWEDTKADRLAGKAEELVNCILRRRKAWEEEQAANQQ
jgi:hypothetical protein